MSSVTEVLHFGSRPGHRAWMLWLEPEPRLRLNPLPSEDGAPLSNELVLEMFSAGDLLDALGILPGSLADIPGSVDTTSD